MPHRCLRCCCCFIWSSSSSPLSPQRLFDWLAKNLSAAASHYLTNTCHAWEQLSLFDMNVSADSIIKIAGHFDIHTWRWNAGELYLLLCVMLERETRKLVQTFVSTICVVCKVWCYFSAALALIWSEDHGTNNVNYDSWYSDKTWESIWHWL